MQIPRPMIDKITAALKANDAAAARDAFDDHDAAWHGIEVYTNTRSLTLYLSIEADYQAQIKSGLDKTPVDFAALTTASQALAKRFDEAIAISTKGPALSPLYDDLAAVHFARADLQQIITPALTRNDLAKARTGWTAFKAKYPAALDLVKFRSVTAADEMATAYSAADAKFQATTATAAELTPLVATLATKVGVGTNLVNAAARNSDVTKKALTDIDLYQVYALRDMELQLRKSLNDWQKGDYTSAKTAVGVAQNQAYLRVGPALALRSSDAALSSALKGYADLAGAAGDAAKVTAANKTALDAVAVAQQVLVGQFWNDPKLQDILKTLTTVAV